MFSAHDIIPVSRFTKENPKKVKENLISKFRVEGEWDFILVIPNWGNVSGIIPTPEMDVWKMNYSGQVGETSVWEQESIIFFHKSYFPGPRSNFEFFFEFFFQCSVHGEHYIMFSTVRKAMLCINCYKETAMEARLHCVDLDTAYSQGCRKLDRAVMVRCHFLY